VLSFASRDDNVATGENWIQDIVEGDARTCVDNLNAKLTVRLKSHFCFNKACP